MSDKPKPTAQEGWTATSVRSTNHYFRNGLSLCKGQRHGYGSQHLRIHAWDNGHYFIMEMWSSGRCRRCMKLRGKEIGKAMDYRPMSFGQFFSQLP